MVTIDSAMAASLSSPTPGAQRDRATPRPARAMESSCLRTPPDPALAHLTSRYPLRVRFCETDLMGVVHHANYLTYFEAGRVDWLHRRGVSYDAWTRRGIHLPVVDARVRYRKAARFDDELVVETTCVEQTRVTVRFGYRILRGDELLCEGETLLACVGHELTARRLPDDVARVFRSPEGASELGPPA
jgi:acyl-CoA thioester hydrolase